MRGTLIDPIILPASWNDDAALVAERSGARDISGTNSEPPQLHQTSR